MNRKSYFPAVAVAFMFAFIGTTYAEAAGDRKDIRLLTMEEAVMGTGLGVQRIDCLWADDSRSFSYVNTGALCTVALPGGNVTMEKTNLKTVLPADDKSPIAYSRDGNVYYTDKNGMEHAVTTYDDPGIVCGESVSRNEFGISTGIFVSPDNRRIAFYRKDESRVTLFPLLDITTRTGSLREIRYPMNGMTSEIVTLGIYDTVTGNTVWLDVTDFTEERYLTCVTWGPESDRIYIQVLDRAQKNMHLNVYDATSGKFLKTLLTEHNDRYVEPQWPLRFLDIDRSKFIYQTDNRDGFSNLYLCDTDKGNPVRITSTDADVEFVAQRGNTLFYYSSQVSPVERHLFRVNLDGSNVIRLTKAPGWHSCSISPDGNYFIDDYTSKETPRKVAYGATDGSDLKEFFSAPDPTFALNYCDIEMGTIKSADGRFDNWYRLIRPLDFDPGKKYPVILYVYGGPHSQLVRNTFHAQLRNWEMYMAQHGYVVFVMDNRGTEGQGAEYEKAIHRMCGQAEMADQMKGIEWLLSHPWVDKDRIGIHGWSYGGFMTISLMVNYPDIFKVGVAGGPVIDWKWYEIMYGERYMETEETNPQGFALTSLVDKADKLKGKLLICQGAIDGTVVWQHSLNFIESCIKNGIPVDYFPYPTHEHNVSGRDRIHLMQKVTDYFDDYL